LAGQQLIHYAGLANVGFWGLSLWRVRAAVVVVFYYDDKVTRWFSYLSSLLYSSSLRCLVSALFF